MIKLLPIVLLRSPRSAQEVPKVLVAGREFWMGSGRGMRGNANILMHFKGTSHCQSEDTEFRSNAVLPLSYSFKKPTNSAPPSNETTLKTNSFKIISALLTCRRLIKFIPAHNALKQSP